MIALVLGGQKSGKSAYALGLLEAAEGPRALVATGRARDLDFRAQILRHRKERNPEIDVLESGPDLLRTLRNATPMYRALLVDSLDFWLFAHDGTNGPDEVGTLLEALCCWEAGTLILVSSETGLGPLAADAATRRFVRRLGGLNQSLAAAAHEVHLVAAGLPLRLK